MRKKYSLLQCCYDVIAIYVTKSIFFHFCLQNVEKRFGKKNTNASFLGVKKADLKKKYCGDGKEWNDQIFRPAAAVRGGRGVRWFASAATTR